MHYRNQSRHHLFLRNSFQRLFCGIAGFIDSLLRRHFSPGRLQRPANVHDFDSEGAVVRAAVIRGTPLGNIRDIRLRRRQRLILLTERNQVLPNFVILSHHLAP